jgi:hydrogenase nickel incorporation protein HypB
MEEVRSITERIRRDGAALRQVENRSSDLLAAERLLNRSLFHLERALAQPPLRELIDAQEGEMLDIEIEEDLLEANRGIAEANRRLLVGHGIRTLDVMGAIGSGKTSLISAMVEHLGGRARCGMIGGDVATSIDAERVRRKGATTIQVNTGKECHLDANLVRRALERLKLDELDVLFVENVGNLICPSEFDLGCEKRLVVISVTEGDSMVVKHPLMFMDADAVAINKIDMAEHFGTDVGKLEADLSNLSPGTTSIRTSTRTGQGVEELLAVLDLPG